MRSCSILLQAVVCAALAGCGGGGGDGSATPASSGNPATAPEPAASAFPPAHSQCSLAQAKQDVLDIFETFYFFNEIPAQRDKYGVIQANLSGYPSVDALLDDLRYQSGTFDRGFSYYATREQVDQFFSAGEFFGFGFTVGIASNSDWRLIDVFGGSPADLGGLVRSDTILAVDGVPTAALNLNSEGTFGPSESGVQRALTIRSLDTSERTVTLTKTAVDLDPVPAEKVRVFDVAGRKVGYVLFRAFIEKADDLLRAALADLGAQGIDDLVLDLRYNGGGLVDTAETLGSLMAGNPRAGQIFFSYEYNDFVTATYGSADDVRQFRIEPDALTGLEHVYYLTDRGTASASELVISGLSPYLSRSVTVGAGTFGKPVGQWGIDYCNDSMILFVVTFRTVNVDGEADYYGGIPAQCAAADDWDHALGDAAEGRLRAALDYIESNGSLCTPAPTMATMSLGGGAVFDGPEPIRGTGLAGKLLNAY